MLDQLVESKNNSAENTRRGEFVLVTFILFTSALLGGWTYSLFAKDYGMGSGDLDISSLVAPVALPEEAPPPPPEPEAKPEKSSSDSDKPTVIDKFATMEATKEPPKELAGQQKVVGLTAEQSKRVTIGTENNLGRINDRSLDNQGGGLGGGTTTRQSEPDDLDEIKVEKKETPTPKPPPKIISGGVVNGKATNLVKPPYPAAARAVRAAGAVNVQVTIDENGNVISASAVSGHPLLRAAATQAARSSKFSPTLLSGQPVKVTGVIVYNFQP